MSKVEVPIWVASNQKNLQLAKKISQILEDFQVTPVIVDLVQLDWPLYSPLRELSGARPNMTPILAGLSHSKGLIVLAPEYNGGTPPTLVNTIAWISRSGEKNWRHYFLEKFCVLGTHSGSGGLNVLNAMRLQMAYIGLTPLARSIHTNMQKPFRPDSAREILGSFCSLLHTVQSGVK